MGKANRTGRSKVVPFVNLHRGITGSAAWRSLSPEAVAVFIAVYERHNGRNNGEIPLSYREVQSRFEIGPSRTKRAFSELEDKGFLIVTQRGAFTWKQGAGAGKATRWEITSEPRDGHPPKALYRTWQPPKNQNTASLEKPLASLEKPICENQQN